MELVNSLDARVNSWYSFVDGKPSLLRRSDIAMGSMTSESQIFQAGIQTVTLAGQRFVIVPEREYRRLRQGAEDQEPKLPEPDVHGNFPAVESMRVLLARDILRARRAAGLTQVDLARRAGIRPETLNRIEKGKHTPSLGTIERIDRALKQLENRRK